MKLSFKAKICGITRSEDAIAIAEAGTTAIGLNFSQHSKRRVSVDQAKLLAAAYVETAKRQAVRSQPQVVGVFVEQNIQQAVEIARQVPLDVIQLHGDHPIEDVAKSDRPVIWVLRIKSDSATQLVQQIQSRLHEVQQAIHSDPQIEQNLLALLLDAHVAGQWGGTGQPLAWQPLSDRHHWNESFADAKAMNWPTDLPLILAGGITAENVQQAIEEAKPEAVDVASGVESSPGVKDPQKVQQLMLKVHQG